MEESDYDCLFESEEEEAVSKEEINGFDGKYYY